MGEEKFEEEKEREEERENEKVSENGENEKAENCEKAKNESETPLLNEDLRHPLDNSWDFWYLSADKNKEWDERMTKIMTFSTVEDFWAVYHHVALPSRLHIGADYMVFKS